MWFLIVHGICAMWVCIDSIKRKANVIPWVIGTTIFGPILLPIYVEKRPFKTNKSQEGTRSGNLLKSFAIFWTVLLIVDGIWSPKKNINSALINEPLEYRLAAINSKCCISKDDVIVDRFSSLLDQLSMNCVEDQQQIANISVIARKKIGANGNNESLLNIMEDLNDLIYMNSKNQKYTDYMRTYIVLRNDGLSHDEAIERLQCIIRGY